jgi:hypothetical protein
MVIGLFLGPDSVVGLSVRFRSTTYVLMIAQAGVQTDSCTLAIASYNYTRKIWISRRQVSSQVIDQPVFQLLRIL